MAIDVEFVSYLDDNASVAGTKIIWECRQVRRDVCKSSQNYRATKKAKHAATTKTRTPRIVTDCARACVRKTCTCTAYDSYELRRISDVLEFATMLPSPAYLFPIQDSVLFSFFFLSVTFFNCQWLFISQLVLKMTIGYDCTIAE